MGEPTGYESCRVVPDALTALLPQGAESLRRWQPGTGKPCIAFCEAFSARFWLGFVKRRVYFSPFSDSYNSPL